LIETNNMKPNVTLLIALLLAPLTALLCACEFPMLGRLEQ